MGQAASRAMASAWWTARDLGVISPKKRMRKVIAPVATPTPAEPKAWVASSVTRAVAAMFTRLLPTRMVVRKRVMSSARRRKGPFLLSASSFSFHG
ncbi:hypothetical protein RLTM_05269 [Thermus parvatiensis]|uniref:Uncharacterized protein n=1 Tax=Thermus parvatiensis TaxID=456163 RepID=H7GFR7_9DEIN|nr:hypothetical protein RLTM_05269 [Thermus parvatiensis]